MAADEYSQSYLVRYGLNMNLPPVSYDLVFGDILSWLPDYKFDVIFDVGANIGLYTAAYARAFPDALIFSFEPVPGTFGDLVENTKVFKNVKHFQAALSSSAGKVRMTEGLGSGNRITADGTIEVPALRGDQFEGHIDFLKIDAEAHELEILKGFGDALNERVSFIQLECAANRHVKQSLRFRNLELFMEERGFYLFHIYDQVFEFKVGKARPIGLCRGRFHQRIGSPLLRRFDAVFINEKLIGL